jgi:hypothetical protein
MVLGLSATRNQLSYNCVDTRDDLSRADGLATGHRWPRYIPEGGAYAGLLTWAHEQQKLSSVVAPP